MKSILTIQGMHCASCKALIEETIQETPDVTSCAVDVEKGIAEIEHGDAVNLETFKEKIESLGEYRIVGSKRRE